MDAEISVPPGTAELFLSTFRTLKCCDLKEFWEALRASDEVQVMNDITGLAAVVMLFSIPLGAIGMYTYYRVNKLRTEEGLAAIARV